MNISSVAINRPVLASVISIAIVIFGLAGFSYLGIREYPNVDPPVVTVTTNYTGADAEIIESQITEPLEESINGIAGIRSLNSISSDGRSTISVEFELGIGMDNAANDVRDRVSQAVRNLPPDADPPVVVKSDANAQTILSITVSSDKRTLLQLTDLGLNVFKERLQTIPGVSQIRIWGEKKYAMRLDMDPEKIAAYGLTPLDVRNALLAQNVELPSGRIEGFEKETVIRTFGRLSSEADFNGMIIAERNGALIRFRDVGKARLAPENERTLLRGDGGIPMIGVAFTPQPGANYIEIVDEAYRRVEQIRKDLPDDIRIGVALDTTTSIRQAISEVESTIGIAFILVVLIIFLFLRDWRTTLIPALAIPISLVGSFFIMYAAGFSINILTLLAIVLATGIVVDDAIVVMENIYARIERGTPPTEAAHKGSAEIFFAIISTTITLCAVFLPIIFLQGLTGRLFREFGIVVAGAVLISAIVSLTLTPMMSARLLRHREKPGAFYRITERFFDSLMAGYAASLTRFMNRRWIAFPIVLAAVAAIWILMDTLPRELAPVEDKSRLRIYSTAPEGTSFEKMDDYTLQLVRLTDTLREKESLLSVTSPGFGASVSTNTSFVRITLVPPGKRRRSQDDIARALNPKVQQYNFARSFVVQEQTISTGSSSRGLPIQYVLQAPTLEKLKAVLPAFLEQAYNSPVFDAVDYDLKFNKPELTISINREKARTMGVAVRDIAETLQLFFSGQRFGYFILEGKQYQVIGQANRESRNDVRDIAGITVHNRDGQPVRLDNLVTMKEESSPPQLFRYNRYVSATVSASPAKGRTLGQGIDEMDRIAAGVLDESFSTTLAGTSKDFSESSGTLLFAFVFALLLIYLALSAQFESFLDPLTIMLTVPLALAGALISLWLFGHTLNIFSQIGIIVLVGIVTKNGILIVEFANQRQAHGLAISEAVIDAAARRFRPIVMTSLSTALGALPIALALGGGATSRIPMGIAIIGGLVFSLGLTLYVIPALYVYIEHLGAALRRGRAHRKDSGTRSTATRLTMIVLCAGVASLLPGPAHAQTLTFEEAAREMVTGNFDIRIEKNNRTIISEKNHAGEAGFLPTLDAGFGYERSLSNTDQSFYDGRTQQATDARSTSVNASALLSWTLFDGFRMFAMKDILDAKERIGAYALQAVTEEAVELLAGVYYGVVLHERLRAVYDTALSVSQARYALALKRKEIGSASRQEVLQALVDRNADSVRVMQESAVIEDLRTELNLILGRNLTDHIEVPDEISADTGLVLSMLLDSSDASGTSLLIARENVRIAMQERKAARAAFYPRAGIYAGYDYGKLDNQAGVLRSNTAYGPSAGVFVTFNLFNGLRDYRDSRIATLQQANSRITAEKATAANTAAILTGYRAYALAIGISRLEQASRDSAAANVRLALKRFALGEITSVEFREIQLQAVEADSRLLTALYSQRINEVKLKRLAGILRLQDGPPAAR